MSKPKSTPVLLFQKVANILEADLVKENFVFDKNISGYFRTMGKFTEFIQIYCRRPPGDMLTLTFGLGMRHSEAEEIFWNIELTEPLIYHNFSFMKRKDIDHKLKYSQTSWNNCINTGQWSVYKDLSLTEIEPRLHSFIRSYALPWLSARQTLPELLEHLKAPINRHDQTSFREVRALIICLLLDDKQEASRLVRLDGSLADEYWKARYLEFVARARVLYPWFESIYA